MVALGLLGSQGYPDKELFSGEKSEERQRNNMREGNNRIITVLLTRYHSTFANFIYWVSGRGYTHASLGLDEKDGYYYSFNFNGFKKEYPGKRKKIYGNSISYKLEVSQEEYETIREAILEMEHHKEQYRYSRLSLLFCLIHIPCKIENQYFCSQFVAEMLQLSKSVKLKKSASLYLPNDLPRELKRQHCLKEIVYNPV